MKVIDLLNKIANGEEVPETFIYNNLIFELNESGRYIDNEGDYFTESIRYDLENLNEKVIIVEDKEEDKKIEKIDFDLLQSFEDDDDKYISIEAICKKIDEIIDKLNKEE